MDAGGEGDAGGRGSVAAAVDDPFKNCISQSRAAAIISCGMAANCGAVMIISIKPGSARYLARTPRAMSWSVQPLAAGTLLPSITTTSAADGGSRLLKV